MSRDDTAPRSLWAGAISTIRHKGKRVNAQRLYHAFAMAIHEAHTRGRLYSEGGEKALPGDEFNATQAACERIFFTELRKKEPKL